MTFTAATSTVREERAGTVKQLVEACFHQLRWSARSGFAFARQHFSSWSLRVRLFHGFPDDAVVVDGHYRRQSEQECCEDQDGPEGPGGGDPVHPLQTDRVQVEAVESGKNPGREYPGYRHRGSYCVARDAQGSGQTSLIPSCDEADKAVQDEHRCEEASVEQYWQRYQRSRHEDRQDAKEQPCVQ